MYEVTIYRESGASAKVLDIENDICEVLSANLDKQEDNIDTLSLSFLHSFVVNKTVPLTSLKTLAKVVNKKTGNIEFKGRLLTPEDSMSENGNFGHACVLEGAAAYLKDTIQSYAFYFDKEPRENLQTVIDNHNRQVTSEPYKQFVLGTVNVPKNTIKVDEEYREDEKYFNTWDNKTSYDTLFEDMIGKYKGHFVFEYTDGPTIIHYLVETGSKKSTVINLGRNLKNIQKKVDPTEIITRVKPLGASMTLGNDDEGNLTIADVNNGSPYIDIPELQAIYGIQEGVVDFPEKYAPILLKEAAQEWIAEQNKNVAKVTISLSAVDLALIGIEPEEFELYGIHETICEPLEIHEDLKIVGISIDLLSPQNKDITIGEKQLSLSEIQNQIYKETVSTVINETMTTEIVPIINKEVEKQVDAAMGPATDELEQTATAQVDKAKAELQAGYDASLTTAQQQIAADNAQFEKDFAAEKTNIQNSVLNTISTSTNLIKADALLVDSAMINKLMSDNLLVNKLVADTAFVNTMNTKSLNAVYADVGNLRAKILIAGVITAEHLTASEAMIDKLFASSAYVDRLFAKQATIDHVQTIDIDLNRATIKGGTETNYIRMVNDSILSYGIFMRTWGNVTDTANLKLGINKGLIQISNIDTKYNLYMTEKGLSTTLAGAGSETAGTLEFHSTRYNQTSRGVTLHSTYGAAALASEYSRVILDANLTVNIESETSSIYFRPMRDSRVGNNEFRMWVKDNSSASDTDGVLSYGSITSGSSYGSAVRFDKSSSTTYVYATDNTGAIGTGDFFARYLLGDWKTKGENVYALVDGTSGKLRITDTKGYNGGNISYRDLQCKDIQANSLRTNTGANLYVGTGDGEVRITDNLLYNGGTINYRDIRFKNWFSTSSEQYKTDITPWDYDVLEVIKNDLKLYTFKFISEMEQEYTRFHHGVIVERETPIEWVHGDGVDQYEVGMWTLKGVQELILENEKTKKYLNDQQIEINELKAEISAMKESLNVIMNKVG